jgi:glycine reductase
MLGVCRIIVGKAVPHPLGDPNASKEEERIIQQKYLEKAFEMLQQPVEKTVVETIA